MTTGAIKGKIETFINNDGVEVHAVFVATKDVKASHRGTFATKAEAERRLAYVQSGKPEKWEEPE